MKLKAIRGATYSDNTIDSINFRTTELYKKLLDINSLKSKDIVCVIIGTTADLTAACPATAIRTTYEKGKNPPLFSTLEPNFDGADKGVIRLMILAYTKKCINAYLHGTNKFFWR